MPPNQSPSNRRITRGSTKQQRQQLQAQKSLLTGKSFHQGMEENQGSAAQMSGIMNYASNFNQTNKLKQHTLDTQLLRLLNDDSGGQSSSPEAGMSDGELPWQSASRITLSLNRQSMSAASQLNHQLLQDHTTINGCISGRQRNLFVSPNPKESMAMKLRNEESGSCRGSGAANRQRSNSKSTTVLPFCSPIKTIPQAMECQESSAGKTPENSMQRLTLPYHTQDQAYQVRNSGTSGDGVSAQPMAQVCTLTTTKINTHADAAATSNSGFEGRITRSAARQNQSHQQQQSPESALHITNIGPDALHLQSPSLLRDDDVEMQGEDEEPPALLLEDSATTNAFSSLLRAVAKLRLYTLEETQNDCTQLKVIEQRRSIRSTAALDYLISKSRGRHLKRRHTTAQVGNTINADSMTDSPEKAMPTTIQAAQTKEMVEVEKFITQTIEEHSPDEQQVASINIPPSTLTTTTKPPTEAQLASKACYEQLLQISTETMKMLVEALSVIDQIYELEQARSSNSQTANSVQQAGITIEELNQVKSSLQQKYAESKQQVSVISRQILPMEPVNIFAMSHERRVQEQQRFCENYETFYHITNQLKELLARMKSQNDPVASMQTQQQQQQSLNLDMAEQAKQELDNQIFLKQQLQELMSSAGALALDGYADDPETLQKIATLHTLLEQLAQQQSLLNAVPSAQAAEDMKQTQENLRQAVELVGKRDMNVSAHEFQQQLGAAGQAFMQTNDFNEQHQQRQQLDQLQQLQLQQQQAQNPDDLQQYYEQEETLQMLKQMAQLLQEKIHEEQGEIVNGKPSQPQAISQKTQELVFQFEGLLQQFNQEQQRLGNPMTQSQPLPNDLQQQQQQLVSEANQVQQLVNRGNEGGIAGANSGDESNQAQLDTIKQMLQEYCADPFVEECLKSINNLQKILREGTAEQHEQAQGLIVNLVGLLQRVDLSGLQLKADAQQLQPFQQQAAAPQQQQQAASQIVAEEVQRNIEISTLQQQAQALEQLLEKVNDQGGGESDNAQNEYMLQLQLQYQIHMLLSQQQQAEVLQTQQHLQTPSQEPMQPAQTAAFQQQQQQHQQLEAVAQDGSQQAQQQPEAQQMAASVQDHNAGVVQAQSSSQPQQALIVAENSDALTEEQRMVLVHNLNLNLQEQQKVRQALEDANCLQTLYKELPHQLIEVLQYLKQLAERAEEMQKMLGLQEQTAGVGVLPDAVATQQLNGGAPAPNPEDSEAQNARQLIQQQQQQQQQRIAEQQQLPNMLAPYDPASQQQQQQQDESGAPGTPGANIVFQVGANQMPQQLQQPTAQAQVIQQMQQQQQQPQQASASQVYYHQDFYQQQQQQQQQQQYQQQQQLQPQQLQQQQQQPSQQMIQLQQIGGADLPQQQPQQLPSGSAAPTDWDQRGLAAQAMAMQQSRGEPTHSKLRSNIRDGAAVVGKRSLNHLYVAHLVHQDQTTTTTTTAAAAPTDVAPGIPWPAVALTGGSNKPADQQPSQQPPAQQ